jgi:aminomethyltransferase
MNRTPLFPQHQSAGAKLVDFTGWEMPIQYTGVLDEYRAVRSQAGLFDVSHMGRLLITGAGAERLLQGLTTNDVRALSVGQAQYSMVCNERGGIKDDVFVYRMDEAEYLLCVNASNRIKILDWLLDHHRTAEYCRIEDCSATLAQVAIQGPASRDILLDLGAQEISTLKLHHTSRSLVGGIACFVARTGYTGELGYELNVPVESAGKLWEQLLDTGRPRGLKPAGLGARDLLRLEMGYLLYGNDIGEDTTPLEANAGWVVNFQKGEFVGSRVLLAQRQTGVTRQVVGFELLEKSVPRHGFKVLTTQSEPIGEVTSGNLSPILQKGIGLASVPSRYADPGTAVLIDVRGKSVPGRIVKPPFYKKRKA